MANLPVIGRKLKITDGNNLYFFGDAGTGDIVSTFAVFMVASGLTGGSTTVSAVTKGDAIADAVTPVPVPYKALYLNGSVGSGSLGSAAITSTSLILVPASGLGLVLNIATISAGSWTIYTWPVAGAAA